MNFTNEQLSAINEEGNIIVSAGAGSGKTAVLSERVIRKLKDGSHINKLLILTFTEAAALEMKERIRKKIIKNNLKEELLYIDSSFITTFDSYALSIVKKYYYLLNINPDISIITNLDIEKNKIIEEIFESNYENNELFKEMINDLCMKDDVNIRNYILSLGEKISLKTNYSEYLDSYISSYYNEEFITKNIEEYINYIKEEINKLRDLLKEISLFDGDYYNKIKEECDKLINSETYEEIVNNINIDIPRLSKNSTEELKESKDLVSKQYKKIASLIKYEDKNLYKEEILSTKKYSIVIIDLLKQYLCKLSNYKKSINRYEFNDISHMAIKVIEQNNDVREEIKKSFDEIMIDEYQDTNDIQEYFISLISKNNVYMVGDIKQSIYRFRNANPLIFKNKYDLYKNKEKGIKIDLNKNFRSREEVLNSINNIFNYLMDDNYGEANYKLEHQLISKNDIYKTKKEDQNYDLEILKYDENDKYTKEEMEIFIIADDIINKVKNKYQVLENGVLRDCKYEDFAILVDRSNNFDLIKKIFEYKKIPLTILKEESVNNSDELYIFRNIITLLIKYNKKEFDIEFKYSLVSILRCYLIEYSDEEIFKIITGGDYLNNVVIERIKKIELLSINSILNKIISVFDIYSLLVNVGDIDSRSSLINYILSLGEEKSSMGYDIEDFNNYLGDLIDYKLDVRYNVLNSQSGVKLMTIFKSKGLEFPICYMPFLYKQFNTLDLNDLISYDNNLGIICPYVNEGIKTTFYKDIVRKEYLKDEISEKIRLFYVALTRAKEKVILLHYNDNKLKRKDRSNSRSFRDFINYLENCLSFISVIPNVDINYKKVINIDKLVINKNNNIIKELDIKKQEIFNKKYSHSSNNIISKEEYNNMKYGIKLHEFLEEFDLNNEYVKRFINHNEIKDIDNSIQYHEYEFTYNGNIGIIDLMLEYKDKIIIIDYKTEDINKKEYFEQVKGYIEYIKYISNKKVVGYLYSIINDKFMEVL